MEFDWTWGLWALPLTFAAGWLASRFDARQLRWDRRTAPKSYFKGLNHLLNEQQDEAIDAFIEAVQQDPDTSELHFALGNLFRSRGDYDRAIRVHQHLLSRADLSASEHDRARLALARDFMKAGILDRAEEMLQQLQAAPLHRENALEMLLTLYERTREWDKATGVAERLEQAEDGGSYRRRQAHHWCELAAQRLEAPSANSDNALDSSTAALELLRRAQAVCPDAPRPRMDMAAALVRLGRLDAACDELLRLATDVPQALPLVAVELARLGRETGRTAAVRERLVAAQAERPCVDVVEALVQLNVPNDTTAASLLYLDHLDQEPSMVIAANWLRLPKAHDHGNETPSTTGTGPARQDTAQATGLPPAVDRALTKACAPLRRYRCAACGFEASRHFWQCPGCQSWDSYQPRRVDEL